MTLLLQFCHFTGIASDYAFIKTDSEFRAAPIPVGGPQSAVLLRDDHTGQGQSDSHALSAGVFPFVKSFKNMGEVFPADSRPIVRNPDFGINGVFGTGDLDFTAPGRVFHTVL